MKLQKRLLVFLSALMVLVGTLSVAINMFAAEEDHKPVLTAVKNGENIEISLVSQSDLSGFSGLQVGDPEAGTSGVAYDQEIFSFGNENVTSIDNDALDLQVNAESGLISISTTQGVNVASGQSLLSFVFKPNDSYDKSKDYTFSLKLTDAYDEDFNDYTWKNDTFTVTYCEEPPAEEEYITFIDTAGNETKLYDSMIRSCAPTANDNYLLSDVLTAAGVTENLADCRYKIASNDNFIVYLDADDYANIALFYNKGWRSTVDDTTGYEGGWYKVKNLETITAENHNHVDCECANMINISRDETMLCESVIHDWDEGIITSSPTCEENGVRTYHCKNNPIHTRTEKIEALGHDWDDGVVTTEPKCEDEGVRTITCRNCGNTYTEAIDKLGHTWASEKKTDKEATCEGTGQKSLHCTVCGAIDPDSIEEILALGHDWDDGVITKEATCTENGEKIYTCKHDSSHTKTEGLEALGHVPAEAVKENEVEATADKAGSYDEVIYCSVCKEEISRTEHTIEKIEYKCVEGSNLNWIKGSEETAEFVFKRTADDETTYDHFKGVQVDGKDVDTSHYTTKKGSVVIDLKTEYLDSLSTGDHKLSALFDDSEPVTVDFTIAEEKNSDKSEEKTNTSTGSGTSSGLGSGSSSGSANKNASADSAGNVKTGDSYTVNVYVTLCILAAIVIIGMFYNNKNEKDMNH